MNKVQNKRNLLPFIISISLVLIVGVTLAWFTARYTEDKALPVGAVALDYTIIKPDNLGEVLTGDVIASTVSISKKANTRDAYARVKFEFVSNNESLTQEQQAYIVGLNFVSINFSSGDGYTWTKADDGYYYLLNTTTYEPLKLTDSSITYNFCQDVSLPDVSSLHLPLIDSSLNLAIKVSVEAIQADNLPNTPTLANIQTYFEEVFGKEIPMGYLVVYETSGGTSIPAVLISAQGAKAEYLYPTKSGYSFDGWFADNAYDMPFDFDELITQNTIIYAKWKDPIISVQTSDRQEILQYTTDATLEELILNNSVLQNNYNFYYDPELMYGVGLEDTILTGSIIHVEEYTSGLTLQPVAGSSPVEYAIGDGVNTYTGTSTNVVLPQYFFDEITNAVYLVTTINKVAFVGQGFDVNANVESIKISRYIESPIVDIQNNYTAIYALSMLEHIVVDQKNDVYTSCDLDDNNVDAIIEKETGRLVFGCKNTIIPEGVTCIGSGAFVFCNIGQLDIPSSVTTIEGSAIMYTELVELTIPETVQNIGASAICYNARLVKLQIFGTLNISAVYSNFNLKQFRCYGDFTEEDVRLFLGDSVTEILINSDADFVGYIDIGEKYITYTYDNNNNIEKTLIGLSDYSNVTEIIDLMSDLTTIGALAFTPMYGLSNEITHIIIPANITTIKDYAFQGCENAYIFCETSTQKSLATSSHSYLDANKVLYKYTGTLSGASWTYVANTNNTIESYNDGSTTYYRLVSDPNTYYVA